MTELKTLKDLQHSTAEWYGVDVPIKNRHYEVDCRKLKAEAIKWAKERKDKMRIMKDSPEAFALWCCWAFNYFFNITEEDLQ